jgi:hypothetical protein
MLRVSITDDEKNSTYLVGKNFGPPPETASDLAKNLLDLSKEWTSICIANVGVSSSLAFVGDALLEGYIKNSLIPFLTEVAIGREEIQDKEGGKTIFSFVIDAQDAAIVSDRMEEVDGLDHASNSKSQAHLGSIISDFEFFLLRIATEFSKANPNRFIQMDEKITVGEVFSAGSIDAIIASKIDKKIRGEMRGSHDGIIKWLHSTLELGSFEQIKESPYLKDFLECCQRRHLFTHNGGVVNETYLSKCDECGLQASSLPKLGDKLSVTQKYLRRASGRAYLLGLFILHMAIQKLGEEEKQASLRDLLSISHDLLSSGNTKLAERVINFTESSKANLSNELKLSFGINRALAKLHDPNLDCDEQNEAVAKVLDNYDWSIVTPTFALALACVRRDFDDILSLARNANLDGLTYTSARTFFVFKEARKIDGFMECFPRRPLALSSNCSDTQDYQPAD